MQPKSDAQLLREYAEHGAESAFAEIVARHTNLVYSAALRQVDSPDIAAEVAQSVFIGLARGARSLSPKLAGNASLAGWLCRSARNISLDLRRDEFRRHSRERQAMENLDSTPDTTSDWERLRPVLDEAMAELSEPDYDALVLRFFKNQDLRSVGLALGVSDDAAQKRVSRALDKLRDLLSQREITTSAAALSLVLAANAVQAAPVGLAVTISAAAGLAGGAAQTSTAIATTKAIAMTTLQKTIVGATLVAVVGTGIFELHQNYQLRGRVQTLEEQQAPLTGQLRQLQQERDDATNKLAALLAENEQLKSKPNQMELLKLRGEVTRLKTAEAQKKNDSIEATAATWAGKANQVKQWLEHTPDERIPELQLLSDLDWLETVAPIDHWEGTNDYRFASSVLRTRAKAQFARIIGSALGEYLIANNGQLPNDLSELKHYFNSRAMITDAMLLRYELLHSGNVSELQQAEPLVSENGTSQNGEYDALFKTGVFNYSYQSVVSSGESGSGPVFGNNTAELKKLFGTQ